MDMKYMSERVAIRKLISLLRETTIKSISENIYMLPDDAELLGENLAIFWK